jgi:oligopeptide transport system permease protein
MWRFLLSRVLGAIPTLLAIVTLAFVLLRSAPGGPFDTEKVMAPEVRANIEHAYHLDEPLPKQYLRYLAQLARGDMGPSFQYPDESVNSLIAEGFPVDVKIGGLALLLACLVGIPLGARAAWRRGGFMDRLAMGVSLLGISIPVYVVAPLLILVFAVTLQWLPAGGWGGGAMRYVILPVVSLALPYLAYVTRIMRASFVEVLEQPYIRTARAKGLATRDVLFRHALRPALMPLAAFLGPGDRRGHHRIHRRRDDVRLVGDRATFRQWRVQSRLHAGDGRHHPLRPADRVHNLRWRTSARCSIRA